MASVGAGEGNLGQEFFLNIFKNDEIWGPILGSGFGAKNGPSLIRVIRRAHFWYQIRTQKWDPEFDGFLKYLLKKVPGLDFLHQRLSWPRLLLIHGGSPRLQPMPMLPI